MKKQFITLICFYLLFILVSVTYISWNLKENEKSYQNTQVNTRVVLDKPQYDLFIGIVSYGIRPVRKIQRETWLSTITKESSLKIGYKYFLGNESPCIGELAEEISVYLTMLLCVLTRIFIMILYF